MLAKLRPFQLERPASMEEALVVHQQAGDAVFLAGGTGLVTSWRSGLRMPPPVVISLNRFLPRHVERNATTLQFGAGATVAALLRSQMVWTSALSDALRQLGTPQVQERATVAGNIAEHHSGSSLLPALLVLNTAVEVRGPTGAADPLLAELIATGGLPRGALLTSLVLPVGDPARMASATVRLGGPGGQGQPRLVTSVAIEFDAGGRPAWARLAVLPSLPGAALQELRADGEDLRTFGNRLMAVAADAVAPSVDRVASARYRSHLVRVVARRALELAVRRHLVGVPQPGAGNGIACRTERSFPVDRHRAERDPARGAARAAEPHRR